jgi:hypothetical protein
MKIPSFKNKWHMEFGHPKAHKHWSWACFNMENRCTKCGLHPNTHGETYVNNETLILCHGDSIPKTAKKHLNYDIK